MVGERFGAYFVHGATEFDGGNDLGRIEKGMDHNIEAPTEDSAS